MPRPGHPWKRPPFVSPLLYPLRVVSKVITLHCNASRSLFVSRKSFTRGLHGEYRAWRSLLWSMILETIRLSVIQINLSSGNWIKWKRIENRNERFNGSEKHFFLLGYLQALDGMVHWLKHVVFKLSSVRCILVYKIYKVNLG